MNNSKMTKTARVLAKICEVFLWTLDAVVVIGMIASLFVKDKLLEILTKGVTNGNITVEGINFANYNGTINDVAAYFVLSALVGLAVVTISAFIFRYIGKIFSNEKPFAQENVVLVKRIGIMAISIPVVEFLMSIIASIACGIEELALEVSLDNIIFGIIVLCLSQFFAYGAKLEDDVEGLV